MKKTFCVTVRKTVIYIQHVEVQAGSKGNAGELALNRIQDDSWEYDADSIQAESVEEVEDAEPIEEPTS